MRRLAHALCLGGLLGAVLIAPDSGSASAVPDHPSVFGSFRARLKVGTEYSLACTASEQRVRSIFLAERSRGSRGFSVAYDPFDGTLARFAVSGNETEIVANPMSPVSGTITFDSTVGGLVGANVIIELAWGVWGDPLDCRLVVAGVEQTTKAQPLNQGWHLSVTGYERGIGALSLAGAAAGQTFALNATGSLFGWLLGGAGVATATGPEGQSYLEYGASPTPFVPFGPGVRPLSLILMEETNGLWTFDLPAAVAVYGGPDLWLLNVSSF